MSLNQNTIQELNQSTYQKALQNSYPNALPNGYQNEYQNSFQNSNQNTTDNPNQIYIYRNGTYCPYPRKKPTYTLEQKIEVINKVLDGEKVTALARNYGCDRSTIRSWMLNAEDILQYKDDKTRKNLHKRVVRSKIWAEEETLLAYINQMKNMNAPCTVTDIIDKLIELNPMKYGFEDRRALKGVILRFAKRRGVTLNEEDERYFRFREGKFKEISSDSSFENEKQYDDRYIYKENEENLDINSVLNTYNEFGIDENKIIEEVERKMKN